MIVGPIFRFATFCWRVVDELVIDTIFVNGSAFAVELTGDLLRFTTTGNVRNYATGGGSGRSRPCGTVVVMGGMVV